MGKLTIASLLSFVLGVIVALAAVASGRIAPFRPSKKDWGEFPSPPRVELLDDGWRVRLLEDFVYIDPRGRAWTAAKDSTVDGASIPKAFWSITGGPFEGQYRNASIVHDEACVHRTERWEAVHRMFYEACRCGGVSELQAKVLYAAVYHFGPRWDIKATFEEKTVAGPDGKDRRITTKKLVPTSVRSTQEPPSALRDKLENYVRSQNPSLKDLEALDPNSL